MNLGLNELFSLLSNSDPLCSPVDEDLFGYSAETPAVLRQYKQEDIDFLCAYFNRDFSLSVLCEEGRDLFELSADAFDIFLHAWMSELPIEAEIVSFSRKILTAARAANTPEQKRQAAARAAADRGDGDTVAVLNAAAKVQLEIHRMMGLLRFSPQNDTYIACCAPDHLVLPILGEYFSARFGETAWAIIDEKRMFCLCRMPGENVKLLRQEAMAENSSAGIRQAEAGGADKWEELWRHYHKTINNESRKNSGLQLQFMPKRYWNYLPEKQ